MKRAMPTVTFADKILIILYLMSYITSMAIQWRNPKIKVRFTDWVFNFVTSSIGAVIAYSWAFAWANIGARMGIVVLISLVSYPTFKFIVSPEAQGEFAQGIGRALLNMMKALIQGDKDDNTKYTENEDNNRI